MKGILAGSANVDMFDARTNAMMASSKTLIDSGLSMTITGEEARGGQGNILLGKYYHDSGFGLKLTDQLWDLNYLALNCGGAITASSDVMKSETITTTVVNQITVTGTPVNFTTSSGKIGWYRLASGDDGSYQVITFTGSVATVSNLPIGSVVCVKYPIASSTARKFTVSAAYIPSIVHAVMTIPLFKSGATAQTTGSSSKIGEIIVDIPNFQLEGAQDLSLSSSGIASVALSGTALATFGDSTSCSDTGYYATITENIFDQGEWDNVSYLAVADGNVELNVSKTSALQIYKIFSDGTQPSPVNNSLLTFTSATPATATVSSAGVVTGVAAGTTTIEIVATGKPTLNTGAVVVVSA